MSSADSYLGFYVAWLGGVEGHSGNKGQETGDRLIIAFPVFIGGKTRIAAGEEYVKLCW